MLNMPICNFIIISIILAISCFISIALAMGYTQKLNKIEMVNAENDEVKITVFKQNNNTKSLKNAINAFKIIALISSVLSLITMMVFMYYNDKAIKYGAYDDFYKKQSINIITNNVEKGFVDQSNLLPDDLKGCIIIYFKYGCIDCEKIHDDLLTHLENVDTSKIYFVSTRSEKGKQILSQYPVNAVPSGVYILNTPMGSAMQITNVLYDINAPETQEHIFLSEQLDDLIEYQSANK